MFRGRSAGTLDLSGKYEFEREENFEQYLKETGVSEELSKKILTIGTTTDIVEEGNKYTITNSYGTGTSFVLDEEYDEPILTGLKSIAIRQGNTLIITSRVPDGRTGIRKYEFTDKAITVVVTFNSVSAKRYYKKL